MNRTWKISVGLVSAIGILTAVFWLNFLPPVIEPPAPGDVDKVEPAPSVRNIPATVDQALKAMASANIAFNAPESLNLNESSQVHLILSLAHSITELKQAISAAGEKHGASIKVSNRMEASLTGHNFDITAITPGVQAVSGELPTHWRWEIYPKKTGLHRLHLTLTAHLEVDGKDTPRAITSFDKKIDVTVTAGQRFALFFSNNWQWLWAAILVPLVTWYWQKRSKNKGKS
ncbi:hypothetical protein SG34_004975 [Thalassomonas viridans]|uniref:Uncharacterized protein n=1 Tax=Thalassomonas viridans TaxID=137584 RepID=A0AAE9Z437_9GAMM|nr:hypothetical protein [Thalassomonas viridans]WDE06280.1 hypothetical protein SG34_004975 [Thalassomonas viridans]